MTLDRRHPEARIYQLSLPLHGAIRLLQAFLPEDSVCANLGLRLLPQLYPPNLVSRVLTRVLFMHLAYSIGSPPQGHLLGQPSILTTSWIRILSRPRHLNFHRPTVTALQIGHVTIQVDYLAHRARTGARPALARSSDASHGAQLRRACTMRKRRAT